MFGVKMAKNLFKKAKSAVKSKTKSAKKSAEKVVSSAKSSAKSHIESLSKQRRDAAVVWGMIEKGNHSDAEIKEICKEKGFDTLLGEL
ncbi:uncharacterized protein METZ01_LOCUS98033 [marine metagenome]|uniref:Uncharacterized protein n=1 Tax=marine metagenome TaxID=408172 RepID=A0A381VY14_9ZZZZ|tara:strand:+ start:710 stop:973 length:264 start_codon:yes stop_codon:yes gene_type:complete